MMDYNLFILRVDLVLSPSPQQITRAHKCHKISKNNPADYYFDLMSFGYDPGLEYRVVCFTR